MNLKTFILSICFFAMIISCQKEPLVSKDQDIFRTLSPNDSGLDFVNQLNSDVDNNILEYLYYYNGGGVAVGDFNGDGLEDVFLTGNEVPDRLFSNKGDLKFEDVTDGSGIALDSTWSSGVSVDDVNGDGLLDIYICKVSPISPAGIHNLLYLNQGDFKFIEASNKLGLDFSGYSTQASFFDYDNDGDLDVYLLNHSVHSVRSYGKVSKRLEQDALSGDRFFENKLNEAEGRFIDVTEAAGIYSSALGYGLCVITADVNDDGWQDIYVGNDFHENDYLYINTGQKTFSESISKLFNQSSKFTMGVDAQDLNGDGLVDIFTTDMLPYDAQVALKSGGEDTDQIFKIRKDFGFEDQYARNHMQIQKADGYFSDQALMTQTYATDWSWSVLLQDFDNNGLADIFISNGIIKRPNDLDYIKFLNEVNIDSKEKLDAKQLKLFLDKMPEEKLKNVLFRQTKLNEYSRLSNSFIGAPSFSNGSAYSDLDLDGDLDLIVNNINDSSFLLENNSSSSKNFIGFQMNSDGQGTTKGSKIKIYCNGQIQMRTHHTTRGYQSSSSHNLHFGLDTLVKVDSVICVWPNGSHHVLVNPEINKYHQLKHSKAFARTAKAKDEPKIQSTVKALNVRHVENEFSDYSYDKLIPELLSREGPAVVLEDFNQDGIEDLFFGGGRYQEPVLFFGTATGEYQLKENRDFKIDAKYEDVDACALDFDKDGDLDLYVMSGGNDVEELDKLLEDRLYLNDGAGNLKRLPISLPHTNGGSVSAADFDGDGFEDIFVGARTIPKAYGLSPYSFLLKNNGGFGVEIVNKERYGMITDSQWGDIDNDGDLDLVICGDWMNVAILINEGNGSMTYKSESLGFENTAGLWNTIELYDLNEDGYLDIVVGNAGKNSKWQASTEAPLKLYSVDMDRNGQTESIIFHKYFDQYMPFMSMDKLISQVPSIRKQFKNYAAFSEVRSIKDFNGIEEEQILDSKQISELSSMIFLSGENSFKGVSLPIEAQEAPIQDFHINNKGELFFVGNHLEFLTELGKQRGNSGGVYRNFDPQTNTFTDYNSLGLPKGLNTRQILERQVGDCLIVSNNDVSYLLKQTASK